MMSVISAFGLWTLGAASGGVVGNFSYATVKKLSKSFGDQFKKYYKSAEDAEAHLEMMSTNQTKNPSKPFRDVEDTFEDLTKSDFPEGFIDEFQKWIIENQKVLLDNPEKVSGGFQIGTQTATGDINNVNGTQIVNRSVNGVKNERV